MSAIKLSKKVKGNRSFYLKPIAFAMACCFTFNAHANPTGAAVVNGQASFTTIGNTLNITNSPNAIINWQGFSINSGETTRFIQQSASSSVLNRVLGTDPSLLLGTLTSNGRVFLINPAGILVGQGARIDVPGFVASTLNLSNSNFLAGKLDFDATPNAGAIQNNGTITTPEGGSVYLIAPQVENNGIINTPKGETILAAGNTVQLVDTGTPGVTVQVTGTDNNATNLGQILADSGRVGMVGAVVKNSGTLSASSLVNQGGRVFLKASNRVEAGGTITANGTTGGKIEVLGNKVGVMDGATIGANGTQGGGTVLIGGDYQGKNPAVQNAQVTHVAATATISADAIDTGNGGKVIVWADDTTQAYGNISARGGNNGGDGGFVEVSGKQQLVYRAFTDTRAPQGKTGTLLLDPTDISLNAAGSVGNVTGSTVYATDIRSALIGSNVILQTSAGGTGDITFTAGNYDFTAANTTNSLSLLAYTDGGGSTGNISLPVGTNITMHSGAALNMVAGWDGISTAVPAATNGFGNLNILGSFATPTSIVAGAIKLIAGNTLSITDATVVSGGNMAVNVGTNLNLTAILTQAILQSGGTQTINFTGAGAHQMNILGGTVANGSVAGAFASVESFGLQTINSTNMPLGITVTAGDVNNNILDTYKDFGLPTQRTICLTCATHNWASIRSNGGQLIDASTITINGGSGGNNNFANIDNYATSATQTITTTGAITVNGGTSGGAYIPYFNLDVTKPTGRDGYLSNDAGISSKTSTDIHAASISLLAGAASYGGATIGGGPTINITTTAGDLVMTAGSSASANNLNPANPFPANYIFENPAAIGNDKAATSVTLHVAGNLLMTGGPMGLTQGSPAMIGGLDVPATVSIYADGGITLGSAIQFAERIGSPSSGSVLLESGLGGTGSMDLGKGLVGAGSTGSVTLVADGTGAAITQNALGRIWGASLDASTLTAIGSISLSGENMVNSVVASANHDVIYNSAMSFLASSIDSTVGNVTISSTLGDIGLGLLTTNAATGTVSVTADHAIYDGNGSGNNITAHTITLSSTNGGVSGQLAISADTEVTAGGSITATAQAAGSYGGIRINNVATNPLAAGAPATVTLHDLSTNGGTITFTHASDIDSANTTSISATTNHGDIFIGVKGKLTESGASITVSTPGSALIGATGDMVVLGSITNASGGLGLAAGNLLDISGGSVSAAGDLVLAASDIGIADGSAHAGGNAYVNAAGDIRINATNGNAASITATNDVFLALAGPTSTLYFNDPVATYTGTAMVESSLPATIYLDFLGRAAGGVFIDGVETLTTQPGGSGFYNSGTPAVKGAGLLVTYFQNVTSVIDKILPPPPTADDIGIPSPDIPVIEGVSLLDTKGGGAGAFDSSSGGIGGNEPGAFGASESAESGNGKGEEHKKDDTASKDEKNGKGDKDKGKKDEKPGKC